MLRTPTARRRRHPRRRDRRGATLVEFALVAQVFFLLVFICIEFCRLCLIQNLAQDAAYYAARRAMVPGATVAEAQLEANRVLGMVGTRGAQVLINGNNILNEESDEITVQITVPIDENGLFVPKFTANLDFTATATMRTERYDGFYEPGT
jgi:Flp pilus assembly protein TadG